MYCQKMQTKIKNKSEKETSGKQLPSSAALEFTLL